MTRLALLLALLFCGCVRVPQPVPPGPDVVPVPTPEVQPIPAGPMRVIVWRETDITRIPEGQLQQFFGPDLHGWFKTHGVPYRIWDQHVVIDPSEELAWRKAAQNRPSQVPWITVFKGDEEFEGPLPAKASETIALLEKYRQ